ncbi:ATP-binding cassette domain-containing protein [Pseudaminobacter soli (ex Li et al. 2025)]|uniref:ABC transporter ATP-binding protein n=1 Tax=Pseudaminobacter soli (ex Li et al. 2025) TaxID=1295366 RepID=A0A2P7S801_9HYPH|nr:ABC transporter ATP-binding protein [Mesorhizobium soli]PSJ58561.1 ABC transporter ATP-binding protein [Mesorhizobium soli]
MTPLLSVDGLTLKTGDKTLVSDLSFSLGAGERMGLIGESGSGKSLTAMAVTGLLPKSIVPAGSILLDGQQVVGTLERTLNGLRGSSVAVVFQEPLTALDPLMKIGTQVAGPLGRRLAREGKSPPRREVDREVLQFLDHVALPQPERIANSYPHEISGGQRQRVAIAMALACKPKLLIADEPTTALDVTTQAEILKLLDSLVRELGMALLFISHDLPVVATVVDRVTVLRNGRAVEEGPVKAVFDQPRHDYTKTLVEAARSFDNALEGTA